MPSTTLIQREFQSEFKVYLHELVGLAVLGDQVNELNGVEFDLVVRWISGAEESVENKLQRLWNRGGGLSGAEQVWEELQADPCVGRLDGVGVTGGLLQRQGFAVAQEDLEEARDNRGIVQVHAAYDALDVQLRHFDDGVSGVRGAYDVVEEQLTALVDVHGKELQHSYFHLSWISWTRGYF